jgi:hypothetical protein
MKKLVFLGFLICSWQAPASATTRTAASCSVADIQEQVKKSADGDTVLVPGGSSTWRTTLTIKVGITLNGQGCVVTWPASPPFGYLYVYANTVANTLITGFTFNGGYAQLSAGGPIHLNIPAGCMPPRFFGNTLVNNVGGVGSANLVEMTVTGLGTALIDHNIFTGPLIGELIQILGVAGTLNDAGWPIDIVPGGPNFVFVEYNTVCNGTYSGTTCTPSTSGFVQGLIASYRGAKWVGRNNTLYYANFDAHTSSPNSYYGVRWVEIYDNILILPPSTITCWGAFSTVRGGTGVEFGNTVTNGLGNCGTGPGMLLGPSLGSSDLQTGTYPLARQAGRGIESPTNTFNYSPFYSWGNSTLLGSGNCSGLGGLCPNNTPAYVEVGSSPTSALCTGNTTVSHPANVCDGIEFGPSQSTPPVQLIRCQSAADVAAGCPVSYTYTPYTNPHPLQNSGTTPAPPVKLSVTVTQ